MNGNWERAVASVYRLGPNQRAVLHCLVDGVSRTVGDIAGCTGRERAQVRAAIPSLVARGYIRSARPARWVITTDGLRAASLLRIHWS
ncbi:hypothetical protein [Nocardia sp. NPDC052566]|uniref:hypothetical protein n=1 Tax=Nocardia sp. NPDC052566 TaxID=3364330 RepID=UPI0037C868D2